MKLYTVHQKIRVCYTKTDGIDTRMNPYRFSPDIDRGTYNEGDFKKLVGDEFFTSGSFAKFCKIGYITVAETRDITEKVAKKSLDIL